MAIPVDGFPDYRVYPDGRIYSLIRHKVLKPSIDKGGYLSVELFNSEGSKRMLVHRIVAKAYIPNPMNLPQINHIDENKSNNAVDNLEWCTAKYNMRYGKAALTRHTKIDYATQKRKTVARQNGKSRSKPVLQIKNGRIIARFESGKEASRKTGIDHGHIMAVASETSNR